MQRKTGVVIFTHGSRLPTANASLIRLVKQLRSRLRYRHIEPCFLQYGRPRIETALRKLARAGCNHIYGYALLLVRGTHLATDIPHIFQQTLKPFADVTWEISAPLLEHPAMSEFVAADLHHILRQKNRTSEAARRHSQRKRRP